MALEKCTGCGEYVTVGEAIEAKKDGKVVYYHQSCGHRRANKITQDLGLFGRFIGWGMFRKGISNG